MVDLSWSSLRPADVFAVVASPLDRSQFPTFSWDRLDTASYRHGYLDFQMYRGGGRRGL